MLGCSVRVNVRLGSARLVCFWMLLLDSRQERGCCVLSIEEFIQGQVSGGRSARYRVSHGQVSQGRSARYRVNHGQGHWPFKMLQTLDKVPLGRLLLMKTCWDAQSETLSETLSETKTASRKKSQRCSESRYGHRNVLNTWIRQYEFVNTWIRQYVNTTIRSEYHSEQPLCHRASLSVYVRTLIVALLSYSMIGWRRLGWRWLKPDTVYSGVLVVLLELYRLRLQSKIGWRKDYRDISGHQEP